MLKLLDFFLTFKSQKFYDLKKKLNKPIVTE